MGWNDVYELVGRIPPGKVMTYGQIAGMLERPMSARAIGWAMAQCPGDVPWHRVVNAKGECSVDHRDGSKGRQKRLLEKEGVAFNKTGRIDMTVFRFEPELF